MFVRKFVLDLFSLIIFSNRPMIRRTLLCWDPIKRLSLSKFSTFPLPAQLQRAMAVVPDPLDCVLITASHSPMSQRGQLRGHDIPILPGSVKKFCLYHLCRLDSHEMGFSILILVCCTTLFFSKPIVTLYLYTFFLL